LTGRGTISVPSGNANGLFDNAVFYLADAGAGFILDAEAGASNRALAGPLQPQTTVGSFATTSLSANMIGVGTTGNAPGDAVATQLLLAVDSANKALFGLEDVAKAGTATANQTLSGFALSAVSATSGRGTITSGSTTYAFYLLAPNQFVFIDETTGDVSLYYTMIPQ
jgi:hypothetical protein